MGVAQQNLRCDTMRAMGKRTYGLDILMDV